MRKFAHGKSASTANQNLKSSLKTRDQAHQCAVLWFEEIWNRKLYRPLGFSSIHHYASEELQFSRSQTYDFINLCRTFQKLPAIRQKVETGELKYTSARVLATVADVENQDEWLQLALRTSRRGLEEQVKKAKLAAKEKKAGKMPLLPVTKSKPTTAPSSAPSNALPEANRASTPTHKTQPATQPKPAPRLKNRPPAAVVPVRLSLEMTPTQFARYEKLWEAARRQKSLPTDQVEGLLAMMESFVRDSTAADMERCPTQLNNQKTTDENLKKSTRVDNQAPTIPPVQIHIHQCPDCSQASIQTSRGEIAISNSELQKALCDCQTSVPYQRNTTSIPPAVRRSKLAAARHQCQRPGCKPKRFLEVHHLIPRSVGGGNNPENLVVLCSSCHGLVHEHKLAGVDFLAGDGRGEYCYRQAQIPVDKFSRGVPVRNQV